MSSTLLNWFTEKVFLKLQTEGEGIYYKAMYELP